ncbi:MFS transporter [Tessaracoccus sp. OH4464_COT-324]|uniref:MFS transporter n=1 Tax=Tessaracoccus sp. OH4464_COT-324 TaxID=2491059 RepID=UPI000F634FFB|nr:MFS transporter [Tessaracoccus sp. OH4464_COT-324]RRD45256.1 MFS transporter [Tessaracoccus sp. OH4464_COT-324]
MNSYWGLLKTKGVARIMASQITARFPSGMIVLALLIHVEGIFHSYGSAGLVLAATSMGQAIAGPVTSRMMGKLGARNVLIATTLICAASLLWIALVNMPLWGFILVGLVSGLSFPPVQPAVRSIYPKLVDAPRLARLFSLDASAQEIIWVMGPLIIALVSLQISSVAGLLLCAGLLVLGGAWFIAAPELGEVRFGVSESRFGAVLRRGPVLLATAVGFLMIGATAAIEASIVKRFGEGGLEAGVILGGMSLASLISGFAFGHREARRWTLSMWMVTLMFGSLMSTMGESFPWTLVAIMFAGIGIAPALAIIFSMIAESVKFSESAEAYGWANTGQLVGAAIGSAIAGFLIDDMGANGGFLTAAAFGLLAVLVPMAFYRVRDRRRRRRA